MNEQDFDLSIRADGYDKQQLQNLSIVGHKEGELISRLESPAPLLLEGIRGSGKTTLLRLTLEKTNGKTATNGNIAAYVSFSRYLLLENPSVPVGSSHPFTLWVSAKILNAVYQTARQVTSKTPSITGLNPFLEAGFEKIISALESTHKQVAGDAPSFRQLPQAAQQALSAFYSPDKLKGLLQELLSEFQLGSVNLLCDEAAQYFKPEFQPLFFSILKSIHTPQVSFKAAVYPTVTYLGADFELGHDASVLMITRPCLSDEWMKFCGEIINRRSAKGDLWASNPVSLEAFAYASFGIPRRFIELVGSMDISSAHELDVLNAIKSHAQRELQQPFDALKARIPTLVREVELATYLLKQFVEDLKQENTVRTYRTAYVAVSKHRALPYALRKSLNLLVYLGILERQAPCKLGHSRETADRLLMNPALIFSENLLADSDKRRLSLKETIERLKQVELEKFKEYGRNSKTLREAVEESRAIETKPCPQCGTDLPFEARFCSTCGAPQTHSTILTQILSLPSAELDLTPGVKAIVTKNFASVGDVFNATDAALDAIYLIGPTRVAIIRHAVDELISG